MTDYKTTAKDHAKRLDIILTKLLKTSRSYVKFLIINNYIKVNNANEKPSYKVVVNDLLSIIIPKKKQIINTDAKVTIIHKDENFVIYDKPWGMSVHPNDSKKPRKEIMLTDTLYRDFPKIDTKVNRMGIVHRLDKNTSGIIVVSLNDKFSSFIKKQFKNRDIEKTYKTIVLGIIKPQEGIISAPITRGGSLRGRMTISGEDGGREAQTNYKVDKYFTDGKNRYSLLTVYPKTGRTHQIRVHLSSIGHPIVGDKLYGYNKKDVKRQLLHAESISFLNLNNKKVFFSTKIPEDFNTFLKSLKKIN